MNPGHIDQQLAALHRLARFYGALTQHEDGLGIRRKVSPEALLAVLQAAGAPIERLADAPRAVEQTLRSKWQRLAEPVVVAWEGEAAGCVLRVPAKRARSKLECTLRLEDRSERAWSCPLGSLPTSRSVSVLGAEYVVKRLPLPEDLPLGYHTLRLGGGRDLHSTSTVICAPRQAPAAEPSWGVFLPLYALHSQESWGAGDLSDLARLTKWLQDLGGGMVGTLPLLASYLDEPYAPSPYTPVSRLFWNEFFADPTRSPEWKHCPKARQLAGSARFRKQIDKLRRARHVDYRTQMRLKREVLEKLMLCISTEAVRRRTFRANREGRARLRRYAAFRAHVERAGVQSLGGLETIDFNPDDPVQAYHLYAQWLMDEQFREISSAARAGGPGLYLDLPLGTHPDGFDVFDNPGLFARGVSAGAPPDRFFSRGQNWGFAPLLPDKARQEGHRHFIACLRHHMQYAGVLRIDHLMSLHRLYWVPQGMPSDQGVYMQYPAEDLYAVIALEAQRHDTVVIGEDLGTVPGYVRERMSEHTLHRMYVAQFEFRPDVERPFTPVPERSIACINTHDTATFASFWQEGDIDDNVDLGLLDDDHAAELRATREQTKRAITSYFRNKGTINEGEPDPAAILQSSLVELASSPAKLVMVNLEDLWGEVLPQNTPGTVDERPNWKRKARLSLEKLSRSRKVREPLQSVDAARRNGGR